MRRPALAALLALCALTAPACRRFRHSHAAASSAPRLVAEGSRVCLRRADDTLSCWGDTLQGALAFGSATPAQLPEATQVALGGAHACAVYRDGSLACWGQSSLSQLGVPVGDLCGNVSCAREPRPVPALAAVTDVALGEMHSCVLLRDGTVRCWGDANAAATGAAAQGSTPVPAPVAGLEHVTRITAGTGFTCALSQDGAVSCWGADHLAQLGHPPSRVCPGPPAGPCDPRARPVVGVTRAVQLTAGREHACALGSDGTVRCWGSNERGQLGGETAGGCPTSRGPVPCSMRPVLVRGLDDVVAISAGGEHTCARRGDGSVWCWGGDSVGTGAARVAAAEGAREIAAGDGFACALFDGETVRCWGRGAPAGLVTSP